VRIAGVVWTRAELCRRDVFHASIRDALDKGKAEAAGFEAAGRPGDGYIHITGPSCTAIRSTLGGWRTNVLTQLDERALPPAGRIGETEDLIGSVFVQDGEVGLPGPHSS
jgi:hypothetical protein